MMLFDAITMMPFDTTTTPSNISSVILPPSSPCSPSSFVLEFYYVYMSHTLPRGARLLTPNTLTGVYTKLEEFVNV